MKKIFILLMLIMSIGSTCFAEDVYMYSFDGVDTYLQTDTIKEEVGLLPGSEIALSTVTYKTIDIFNSDKLKEIKYIYLDNKVDHAQSSYIVNYKYNRLTNEITSGNAVITRLSLELCDSENKLLHNVGKKIYKYVGATGDQYEREFAIYLKAYKFAKDNWKNRDVVKMYKLVDKKE